MDHFIAVTGASGNIGGKLVRLLLQQKIGVRLIARHAERLAPFVARGAEERIGDIQNSAFLAEALRGADAVFAMIPEHPNMPDFLSDKSRTAASLAEAIAAARVSRVVAISAIGVNPPSGIGPAAPHGKLEGLLSSLPDLSVIALRPAFLMENHLGSIPFIRSAGVNGSAVRADIPIPMVCTGDVAAVASGYLAKPDFNGFAVRELLGPRDYSFREATSILGAVIGKPDLPYVEIPYDGLRKGLVDAGLSENAADAIVELQTAFNEGKVQSGLKRNERNTTSTSLEQFARDVFAPAYLAG